MSMTRLLQRAGGDAGAPGMQFSKKLNILKACFMVTFLGAKTAFQDTHEAPVSPYLSSLR